MGAMCLWGLSMAYWWAQAYRGEIADAFSWYERANASHSNGFMYVKCMPEMARFRADPRYKSPLLKVNLLE